MCNSEIERRQAWRETDGFAKASDQVSGHGGRVNWEERVKRSVVRDVEPLGQMTGGPGESPLSQLNRIYVRHSPLFLQMALGFYTQVDYQPPPFPAQREICEYMVQIGLIKEDPVEGAMIMHYVPVHEALKTYVDALCRVPLPVKRWVMP